MGVILLCPDFFFIIGSLTKRSIQSFHSLPKTDLLRFRKSGAWQEGRPQSCTQSHRDAEDQAILGDALVWCLDRSI